MKISIVIPVYNVRPYLNTCLQSVLKQSYKNIEIILVNDGSTDGSDLICETYRAKDSRIIYVSQENRGLSGARNTGMKYASGDYVLFLDSDDFIALNTIEVAVDEIKENHADIVAVGFTQFSDECCVANKEVESYAFQQSTRSAFYKQLITNHACGKIIKKELINDITFPEGRNYEDIATTHKFFYRASSVSYTNSGFYFYRTRPGAITSVIRKKDIDDMILSYRDVVTFYGGEKDSDFYYYRMTLIYTIFSRLRFCEDIDRNSKHKIKKNLKIEFWNVKKDVSLLKYNCPMTKKILLYAFGVCEMLFIFYDIYKK